MAVSKKTKEEIIKKFGGDKNNSGKTEVQIVILTAEIDNLTKHLIENKKDLHSKKGLYLKVSKRRSLLKYLERKDINAYRSLIKELNLRG